MAELFAAVDLGGTNIHAALARGDGRLVAEAREPTRSHEGPEAVLGRMASLIQRLAAEAGNRPAAVGIGVPGLVDVAAGTTLFLPNMPGQWRGVEVRATLERLLGVPVAVLNDARVATLGELVFGHGREADTMVFFTLGTGVGGGVVVGGQLRLGPLGAAGEIGHQTILPDGPLCGCGNRGCLETLASGPAITAEGVRLLLAGNAPRLHEICAGQVAQVTPATMGEAARSGDAAAAAAIRRAGDWLGIAAANLVTALHPDLVVLGGGVAELGELLLDPVRDAIHRRVGMFPTADVRVERSALGDRAGLLGGIALARRSSPQPA